MAVFFQGRRLNTEGGASTHIVSETVNGSRVAYRLQIGGSGSGLQGTLWLTDADLVSLLQRMIKAREEEAGRTAARTKAAAVQAQLERSKEVRDKFRARMAERRAERETSPNP